MQIWQNVLLCLSVWPGTNVTDKELIGLMRMFWMTSDGGTHIYFMTTPHDDVPCLKFV